MDKKRSLFLDTSIIYFIVIVLFVCLRILTSVVNVGEVVGNLLSCLIQIGFMLLVPFFLYKKLRKRNTSQTLSDFHVKKINIKAVLIVIGIGIVVYFLNLAVASFFNIFIFATGYDPSFGMASTSSSGQYPLHAFLLDIVITAILPGICEEFCHRGLLVNGFKQLNPKRTIILVGLLFGLMHLNIEQFFYATIIGMFLTFLVYLTDSIIPSIIVHFLNNAIGLYMSFAKSNNLLFGDFQEKLIAFVSKNPATVFITILFVIIVLFIILATLTYMLLKQTRVNQFKLLAKKAFERKQRQALLESFDLDVNETDEENKSQTQVLISEPIFRNGVKNVMVDFNFSEEDLMATNYKKPSLKDKSFLIGTIVIGTLITIFTLIWGII